MNAYTNCYCCGQECVDKSINSRSYLKSCCLACAREVHAEQRGAGAEVFLKDKTDPRDGDGFPESHWLAALDVVKNRKMKIQFGIRGISSQQKIYTDTCPCGIHPSQCDYHRP